MATQPQLSPLEQLAGNSPAQASGPPAGSNVSPLEQLMNMPEQAQPPSGLSQFGSGALDEGKNMVEGAAVNSGAVGAVRSLWDWGASVPVVVSAYRDARAKGATVMQSVQAANMEAKQWMDARDAVQQRIQEVKQNPAKAGGRAAVDVAAILLPYIASEAGAGAVAGEGAEAEEAPGLAKQVVQGKNVTQPGTQTAVRQATQAAAEHTQTGTQVAEDADILKGNKTVVDEHLSNLAQKEKAAYKQADDAAGFDVKALRDKVATDKYNLKQMGSADPDKAGRLIESINENESRIAEAEGKGVDLKTPDKLHQSRMAGQEYKKMLVKATNTDGTVDLDKLVEGSKALRFNKYGDRLSQFMGQDGATKYMQDLDKLQKLGAHAVKAQQIAKWVGGAVGAGALVKGTETVLGR